MANTAGVGELLVRRAGGVFRGYQGGTDEANTSVLDPDGFYCTGDIVRVSYNGKNGSPITPPDMSPRTVFGAGGVGKTRRSVSEVAGKGGEELVVYAINLYKLE